MKATLSKKQMEVFSLLQEKLGKENVFLVGSCLRDALMGKENLDMDFAVRNDPKSVAATFPYGLFYEKYGTVSFHLGAIKVTIATFRKERSYLDHRHPSEVLFVKSLYEDYKRRDYTCDALYADWSLDVRDPTKRGLRDIRKKKLRMVGNPYKRLEEDPLRILRAYRFQEEIGFHFSRRLSKAIQKRKKGLLELNPEKVRQEVFRLSPEGQELAIEKLGIESLFPEKNESRTAEETKEAK